MPVVPNQDNRPKLGVIQNPQKKKDKRVLNVFK